MNRWPGARAKLAASQRRGKELLSIATLGLYRPKNAKRSGSKRRSELTRTVITASMNIDQIQVGFRYRKDLGDLRALAESIAEVGLLHPVVVTPEGPSDCRAAAA